jgi:mRNA interferase RelE/StbE
MRKRAVSGEQCSGFLATSLISKNITNITLIIDIKFYKVIYFIMKVIWQPKALKQLKKVGDQIIQERILLAARGLGEFPDVPNIKKLMKHEYGYRLRVGNWRILFNAFDEVSIVSIEEVKKRDERTY